MTKNIWIGVVVLVIVLGCGIVEVAIMSAKYKELYDECKTVLDKCDEQSLSVEEYEQFRKKWVKLRETSEILLPHNLTCVLPRRRHTWSRATSSRLKRNLPSRWNCFPTFRT